MSACFERQQFENWADPYTVDHHSNIEFRKCKFHGCSFGYGFSKDYSSRSVAEAIKFIDCEVRKCQIKAAVVRDILIENLRSDVIMVYGALWDRVKFKGRGGKWLIHGTFLGLDSTDSSMARYQDLCSEFYSKIDWAIDISEAEFEDFSLRTGGIPARLVKRDCETQVVVSRERVMNRKWQTLNLDGYTEACLELFLREGAQDTVLLVPKRMKGAHKLVQDLRKLQAEGFAEPD
jgi:hypothetical protein